LVASVTIVRIALKVLNVKWRALEDLNPQPSDP
jgi:hypothetical protein